MPQHIQRLNGVAKFVNAFAHMAKQAPVREQMKQR